MISAPATALVLGTLDFGAFAPYAPEYATAGAVCRAALAVIDAIQA